MVGCLIGPVSHCVVLLLDFYGAVGFACELMEVVGGGSVWANPPVTLDYKAWTPCQQRDTRGVPFGPVLGLNLTPRDGVT